MDPMQVNNQVQEGFSRDFRAPRFSLSLHAGDMLPIADTVDSPDGILFTLNREQDNSDQACVLKWKTGEDGFTSPGLILLHHTPDGEVKEIDVDKESLHKSTTTRSPFIVTQLEGYYIHEVQAGASISLKASLPGVYRQHLVPGERYELLWPGQEINLWDWGDVRQHLGQKLKPREPKISIPSGPRILFTAVDKLEPLRFPSPPPFELSDTPHLEPDGPLTLNKDNLSANLLIKVTYLGASGRIEQRPITFHTYTLQEPGLAEGFRLHRFRNDGWEGIEAQFPCLGIADDPDVEVNVSEHRDFVTLQPGDCWTISHAVEEEDWVFPSDLADGDVLRYRYKGGQVDWWDWGESKDHAHTVVKLPCFVWSKVTEPRDNGGRPKPVVPVSNEILFTYRDSLD
ncbi:hypothetical protein AJ79_10324 [Helicocarpus griseus UAMH5409]|uniref:Uncharacterized protein n=1 Tax=Helicocarpus griseus UAMH5409 TaxID=1447875 RepID=A0A2B7WEU0_9EURO|nr:hypothetical protein AJ79_10324 [Helicocarpus griseus UAMH5409]